MAEPQIKGFTVLEAIESLDARLGSGWSTAAAREFDPQWPAQLEADEWYSARAYAHMLARAYEQLRGYESVRDLVTKLASSTAEEDLSGSLRAFLWVATPCMFLRATSKIWDTYANFTHIVELENETGRYLVQVSEIPAELVDWVTGCWRGFLPTALALAGAQNIVDTIEALEQTPGEETWELRLRLDYE